MKNCVHKIKFNKNSFKFKRITSRHTYTNTQNIKLRKPQKSQVLADKQARSGSVKPGNSYTGADQPTRRVQQQWPLHIPESMTLKLR